MTRKEKLERYLARYHYVYAIVEDDPKDGTDEQIDELYGAQRKLKRQ